MIKYNTTAVLPINSCQSFILSNSWQRLHTEFFPVSISFQAFTIYRNQICFRKSDLFMEEKLFTQPHSLFNRKHWNFFKFQHIVHFWKTLLKHPWKYFLQGESDCMLEIIFNHTILFTAPPLTKSQKHQIFYSVSRQKVGTSDDS